MVCLLGVLCAVLALFNFILWIKIAGYRKAADEICEEMEARLGRDTNVGIDISISDHKMRRLAAEIDRQMKLLRKEQIRYLQGDKELKEAAHTAYCGLRIYGTAGKGRYIREGADISGNHTGENRQTETAYRRIVPVFSGNVCSSI